MWNKKDLEDKLKYLNELSRNTKDENSRYYIFKDREMIIEMIELLKGRKLTIYNNPILYKQKLALNKERKNYKDIEVITFDNIKEDLRFCFSLCKNIVLHSTNIINNGNRKIAKDEQECINNIVSFTDKLSDEELKKEIFAILEKKDHILFNDYFEQIKIGQAYNLSTFRESYIASCYSMPELLLHEIIHSIDMKRNGHFINCYPLSQEVPSYAMQIYCSIKENNINALNGIVNISLAAILCSHNLDIRNFSLDQIKKLDFNNISNKGIDVMNYLLVVKNYLIALIVARKILDNEEKGLTEYKEILDTRFPRGEIPDYSRWGITNDDIIDCSKNLDKYFSKYQKERGGKSI